MRRSATFLPITLLVFAFTLVVIFAHQGVIHAEDDHGDYRFTSTNLVIGSGAIPGVIDTSDIMFDVDYFSFSARRGIKYTFVLDEITVDNANISIVNSIARGNESSPDQELTISSRQKTVSWVATTTDTYYVEVAGTLNNSDGSFYLGNYALSGFEDTQLLDRHADDISGATEVTPGNVYQGAISPWTNEPSLTSTLNSSDDSDFFSFQAERGVEYSVELDLGTSDGVDISIQGESSTLEKTNDGIGNTLHWISPQSRTYYVVVSGTTRVRDSSGTYTIKLKSDLSLLDQHAGTVTGATLASFGNEHQGSVSPADDSDYFSFTAQRGIKYILDVTLGTVDGVSLRLIGTDGEEITSNQGVGSTLEWIASSNGTFLAVISASSQVPDVIGTYSLNLSLDNTLQDHHGDSANTSSKINFDSAYPGAISPETDQDYFSFLAERGVNYSVAMELVTATGAVISIQNTGGETVNSTNGLGTGLAWTAASTGRYYVVVSHSPQATSGIGSYSLVVSANTSLLDRHQDTPAMGTDLRLGNVYQGAISPESDLDFFRFQTKRGVEYLFDLTYGSATAVSLEVNTVGDSVDTTARNFGDINSLRWTAPDSGTYVAKLTSSPKAIEPVGTYSLKVTPNTSLQDRHSDTPMDATRIGIGNAISGAISPSSDYDYFTFMAEKDISYTVNIETGTIDGVRFSVENQSAGYSISNFGQEQNLEWKAPKSGWYMVSISASSQVATEVGTYMVTIERQSDLQPEIPKAVIPTPEPSNDPFPRLIKPVGPTITLESRVAPLGSTLRVPITLINADDISGLGFTLDYDPDAFRVIKVNRGSRLTADTFNFAFDNLGQVRFGSATTKGSVSGGTAAVVEFQVSGSQGTVSPMTLSKASVNHDTKGPLNIGTVGADFKVGPRIRGDADGDGKITTLDAFQVLKMATNNNEADLSLDVDNDGKITVKDAKVILNMARPS